MQRASDTAMSKSLSLMSLIEALTRLDDASGSNATDQLFFSLRLLLMEYNGSTNASLEDAFHRIYTEHEMGPQRDFDWAISCTIIFALCGVLGILGNTLTCFVICYNRFMRTKINLYLLNLAIADLLILLSGLPFEFYELWFAYPWIFGEFVCCFRAFCSETGVYVSVLTITALTVERYCAICHPLRACKMTGDSWRTGFMCIILPIWVLCAVAAVPVSLQLRVFGVQDYRSNETIAGSEMCDFEIEYAGLLEAYAVLFFLIPVTVISSMYILIGRAVRHSSRLNAAACDVECSSNNASKMVRASSRRELDLYRSNRNARAARSYALKMLVAVVASFIVCWVPFHVQRLLLSYLKLTVNKWQHGSSKMTITDLNSALREPTDSHLAMEPDDDVSGLSRVLYHVSGIMLYLGSTVNPILYSIMSLKFREALKYTFRKVLAQVRRKPSTPSEAQIHLPNQVVFRFRNRRMEIISKNGCYKEIELNRMVALAHNFPVLWIQDNRPWTNTPNDIVPLQPLVAPLEPPLCPVSTGRKYHSDGVTNKAAPSTIPVRVCSH